MWLWSNELFVKEQLSLWRTCIYWKFSFKMIPSLLSLLFFPYPTTNNIKTEGKAPALSATWLHLRWKSTQKHTVPGKFIVLPVIKTYSLHAMQCFAGYRGNLQLSKRQLERDIKSFKVKNPRLTSLRQSFLFHWVYFLSGLHDQGKITFHSLHINSLMTRVADKLVLISSWFCFFLLTLLSG